MYAKTVYSLVTAAKPHFQHYTFHHYAVQVLWMAHSNSKHPCFDYMMYSYVVLTVVTMKLRRIWLTLQHCYEQCWPRRAYRGSEMLRTLMFALFIEDYLRGFPELGTKRAKVFNTTFGCNCIWLQWTNTANGVHSRFDNHLHRSETTFDSERYVVSGTTEHGTVWTSFTCV